MRRRHEPARDLDSILGDLHPMTMGPMICSGNSLKAKRPRHPTSANPGREGLVIFTRYPEPGKTKTRLIPSLGADGAADLQRQMTERTLTLARRFRRYRPVSIEVRYEGGNTHLVEQWLGSDMRYRPQGNGDLGQRMARAIHETFQTGMDRVVLVGTDIPNMTARILLEAFENLSSRDMVLGPARDGGYYLIGFRKETFIKRAFERMDWGTEGVFRQTLSILKAHRSRVYVLPAWNDIDTIEDLRQFIERSEDSGFTTSKTMSYLSKLKIP